MSFYAQKNSMTYQTIGGIFDFWIMIGPTPLDVIQQYSSIVGKPKMPPYWHLGFNQCRWGYHTIQETAAVAQNYKRFNIPLDTMWNDIDYMDSYKDFTTDPVNFPGGDVQDFIDYLHSQGQHYMIIVDPGIKIEPGYSAYDIGLSEDVFIMEQNEVVRFFFIFFFFNLYFIYLIIKLLLCVLIIIIIIIIIIEKNNMQIMIEIKTN